MCSIVYSILYVCVQISCVKDCIMYLLLYYKMCVVPQVRLPHIIIDQIIQASPLDDRVVYII